MLPAPLPLPQKTKNKKELLPEDDYNHIAKEIIKRDFFQSKNHSSFIIPDISLNEFMYKYISDDNNDFIDLMNSQIVKYDDDVTSHKYNQQLIESNHNNLFFPPLLKNSNEPISSLKPLQKEKQKQIVYKNTALLIDLERLNTTEPQPPINKSDDFIFTLDDEEVFKKKKPKQPKQSSHKQHKKKATFL